MTGDERFDVVYADPPWRYGNAVPGSAPDGHYDTMLLPDICSLHVPAADNAVLYLWATAPLLVEGLQVMDAWGFTYKTGAVWDKQLLGVGYWWRGQHEHLLVGVRGHWPPPPPEHRVSSVWRQRRGDHSKKPDAVRDWIAATWPTARRLEMFARHAWPGWSTMGNETREVLPLW